MTVIDIHHEANQGTHEGDSDDALAQAAAEARDLLAKARYEAFSLVTEARNEAEAILAEVRGEASDRMHEAELQAESIVDAARLRADEVVMAEDPNEPANAELEAEHEELTERVSTLRSLAAELEQRFDALTAQAEGHPIEPKPANLSPTEAHAPSEAPVLDYSPAVAPPPRADAEEEDQGDEEKGSFYNRRSAKLPRIGDEGGRSALDMMRSIRGTFDDG